MTVGAAPPSVFDADLPTLSYRDDETPAEVYPRLREAQRHAPVALGPHGPEVLGYHMVRSVLRDTRFQIPPGLNLLVQGITSGPLWDKVVNSLLCLEGDAHHRLRSLTSKAFTPKATLRLHDTMVGVLTNWSIGSPAPGAATSSPTSRARIPCRSSARCSGRPARTGNGSRCGRTTCSRRSASPPT